MRWAADDDHAADADADIDAAAEIVLGLFYSRLSWSLRGNFKAHPQLDQASLSWLSLAVHMYIVWFGHRAMSKPTPSRILMDSARLFCFSS